MVKSDQPGISGAGSKQNVRAKAAGLRRQQEQDQRRRTTRQRMAIGAVVAVALAAMGGGVAWAAVNRPSLADVQTYQVARGHVKGAVTYRQSPPVGGDHSEVLLNCGVYSQVVPNENAVHSLEHGAVWVTYRPDLPENQVAALRNKMPATYAILSPYPDLPAPVVVSAWGHQLLLKGADDRRLDLFIKRYRASPESPEPGEPCTGGTNRSSPIRP